VIGFLNFGVHVLTWPLVSVGLRCAHVIVVLVYCSNFKASRTTRVQEPVFRTIEWKNPVYEIIRELRYTPRHAPSH
jgi:hypothetical protein